LKIQPGYIHVDVNIDVVSCVWASSIPSVVTSLYMFGVFSTVLFVALCYWLASS